eukprot:UN02327
MNNGKISLNASQYLIKMMDDYEFLLLNPKMNIPFNLSDIDLFQFYMTEYSICKDELLQRMLSDDFWQNFYTMNTLMPKLRSDFVKTLLFQHDIKFDYKQSLQNDEKAFRDWVNRIYIMLYQSESNELLNDVLSKLRNDKAMWILHKQYLICEGIPRTLEFKDKNLTKTLLAYYGDNELICNNDQELDVLIESINIWNEAVPIAPFVGRGTHDIKKDKSLKILHQITNDDLLRKIVRIMDRLQLVNEQEMYVAHVKDKLGYSSTIMKRNNHSQLGMIMKTTDDMLGIISFPYTICYSSTMFVIGGLIVCCLVLIVCVVSLVCHCKSNQ